MMKNPIKIKGEWYEVPNEFLNPFIEKDNPKDFLGRTLEIGNEVVFMRVQYRDLCKGTITKLGKKKATIEYPKDNLGRTKAIQFYNQIIKIEEK